MLTYAGPKSARDRCRKWGRLWWSAVVSGLLRIRGVRVGRDCTFYGIPRIRLSRKANISIGNRVTIRSGGYSNAFSQGLPTVLSAIVPGAEIRVEDDCRLSSAVLFSELSITVGSGTYVGAAATITDSDAHPVCPECRIDQVAPKTRAVVIGRQCFLGYRCIITKGAVLGDRTVVGAGTVVTAGDYPPESVIVGAAPRLVQSAACSVHGRASE